MLIGLQVSPPALEADTFGFQQKTLLHGLLPAQRNSAARTQYSLPRQALHQLQHTCHMACAARIAGSLRNRAISADAPPRYLADGPADRANQRRGPRPRRA